MLEIYTDGSCIKDAKGRFGIVVLENNKIIHSYAEREENTTNNRMELKAILRAVELFGTKKEPYITVYSDSQYCVNTYNIWALSWKEKGWIKSDGSVPKNLDLIKAFFALKEKGYNLNLKWVKGHEKNLYNELADALATANAKKYYEIRKQLEVENGL